MADENTDFKPDEMKSPDGNGQPEKNTPVTLDPMDLDNDIDGLLNSDDDTDINNFDDDDTVAIPKAKWLKLQRDNTNYKKGLKSLKTKLKPVVSKPQEISTDKFITKDEFFHGLETAAISKAQSNVEVKDNWKDILKYYVSRRGKDSVDKISADINDAYYLWKKDQPSTENMDNKDTAELAADKAKTDTDTQANQGENKEKKHVLLKKVPITEWYKKPEGK